ncbi:unnamed protein product [Vicia faba]|uniref:Vps16 C-terminal domain-containing protein n=1 Tax=Vicia faba TaxID=3906 RepID=A0AAV0ZFB4_VICFA|nr:unnamed protein product [Vicia faba]
MGPKPRLSDLDLATEKTIGIAEEQNELYYLPHKESKCHQAGSESWANTQIWFQHRRLGHPPFRMLSPQLQEENNQEAESSELFVLPVIPLIPDSESSPELPVIPLIQDPESSYELFVLPVIPVIHEPLMPNEDGDVPIPVRNNVDRYKLQFQRKRWKVHQQSSLCVEVNLNFFLTTFMKEVVIMHWACAKITASLTIPDTTLLEILLDKLKLCKSISYAAVAAHADKNGRRKLAALLVEHEPRSSKQVPLLLSIGEEDIALMKATECGDTDLVYLILFHIWQKRQPLEFFGTIQARQLARDLFITYARCYKHEFLKDFFLSTGQLQDVAFLLWKESWELEKNPMASKGSPLHGPRIKLIEKAQNLFAETKEHTFESKAAEEHAKLLRLQHELEVTTKQAIFVDSSISDTIRTCIVLGNHRAALKVKTEFKVSEKRWYWLKVFALATIKDWAALEKFSKEKKPPIGYRPFVEACIEADEKGEAIKYIPKLADPREKAESYARIGMAKEAADAASQAKDGELLGRLKLTFAQNAGGSSIFDTLRDRLSFQGAS